MSLGQICTNLCFCKWRLLRKQPFPHIVHCLGLFLNFNSRNESFLQKLYGWITKLQIFILKLSTCNILFFIIIVWEQGPLRNILSMILKWIKKDSSKLLWKIKLFLIYTWILKTLTSKSSYILIPPLMNFFKYPSGLLYKLKSAGTCHFFINQKEVSSEGSYFL